MDEGYFPGILKSGKITPIYKKDNPQIFGNYTTILEPEILVIRNI